MESKLGIDFGKVAHAREVAHKIAMQVQKFVDGYTTVAVERTLCRLLGIDGVDQNAVPLPNVVVEDLKDKNVLGEGVLFFLGNTMVATGLSPQQIAEKVKCEAQQSAEQRASGAGSDHRRPHGTDLSRQTADDTGKDDDRNTVSDSLQRDAVTKPKQEHASGGEDRQEQFPHRGKPYRLPP